MKYQNIFLIGPPGAGKTTVGKQVAKRLHLDFFDSDHEIESQCGVDIPWIFDVEGEEGFRIREEGMIDELTGKQGILLATGGGAILSDQNRNRLAGRGTVIYLNVTLEQELSRLKNDTTHPLLKSTDKEKTLGLIREKRDPLYSEIADYTIDTDGKSVKQIAQDICDFVSEK